MPTQRTSRLRVIPVLGSLMAQTIEPLTCRIVSLRVIRIPCGTKGNGFGCSILSREGRLVLVYPIVRPAQFELHYLLPIINAQHPNIPKTNHAFPPHQ